VDPSPQPSSADGGVQEILVALKEGLEAAAVGVFDDDRAAIHLSSEPSTAAFWAELRELTCLLVDWSAWYQALRESRHLTTPCTCGAHAIHSLVLHERWVLLVIAREPLFPGASSVIASAARLMAPLLASVRVKIAPPEVDTGGEGPDASRLGIPMWWVRKAQS
jgi:hypothetical protein